MKTITIKTPTLTGIKGMFSKVGSLCKRAESTPEKSGVNYSTTLSTLKIKSEAEFREWKRVVAVANNVTFIFDKSLDRIHFWNVYSNDTLSRVIASVLIIDVRDLDTDYDLEVFINDPNAVDYPWSK